MLRFTILGSGSSGNCAYLETEQTRILIDAGFSCRQIEERLAPLGRSLRDVDAIFVTHEHTDHICGLPVIARRFNIPIHSNRLTADCLRPQLADFSNFQLFETGATLRHGDLTVQSFPVPHDAYDPVGFTFTHNLGKIGFLTDLGYATHLVLDRVRDARALVLEANHDVAMLQSNARRPWSLKQRILSRHGHLSNAAAAEVAVKVAWMGMNDLFLGHLSAECNDPRLAEETIQRRLETEGHYHVRLHRTSVKTPCATLAWD